MATNLLPFRPSMIFASASSERRRPDPSRRSSSTSGWWTPLFQWSSEPDYIDYKPEKAGQAAEPDQKPTPTRFSPGCFTEEKAKLLRMATADTASFHEAMYHSAIASRLASDFGLEKPDM
ncbi:hypothetical protein SAY87_013759 [Trapa incisa]|uniref:Uncharacterized protein n=1 Tax=Trapa incisa TaxID=236973 RepID=A0AAN7KCG0_9MYRT|nr:hypothetical protein SAY87_013759 [Trapa incisa]